jgi:hypothetical protein
MPSGEHHHHQAAPMASGAITPAPAPMPVHPNGKHKKKSSDEFHDVFVHVVRLSKMSPLGYRYFV